VANHLRQRGYQIVARNWRHYLGELDIIARADDTLVIVEVKARHASEEGTGLASIDARKRNRLMLLAQAFTTAAQLRHLQLRFDVAEVELDKAGFVRDIRYLEDAFQQT
jgi:putative endonuclease